MVSKQADIGIVSRTWNLPSLCVSALTRPSNCQKLVQLPLPIITDFYRSDRIVTQKIGSHACKSWRKYNVEVCQFIVFAFEMTDGNWQIWHIWQSRKFRRDILWQLIVVFNVVVEKRISVIVPWLLISSRLLLSSLLYCEGLLLAEKQDLLALTRAPVCHWNLIYCWKQLNTTEMNSIEFYATAETIVTCWSVLSYVPRCPFLVFAQAMCMMFKYKGDTLHK